MNPHIIKNPKLAETCISKTQYFEKFLANTDYVLCNVSAAEYIGLCNWTTAPEVYVYTKQECVQNHIEILSDGYLWYTTVNQTINDLLKDNTIDDIVIALYPFDMDWKTMSGGTANCMRYAHRNHKPIQQIDPFTKQIRWV